MPQDHDAHFFRTLTAHIMEGIHIPKVQIERVIGPVFGMFCERTVSHLMNGDEILNLCPEFPLRKGFDSASGNNQSTNVDWLLYNRTKAELIFLELKTADTSFDLQQAAIYSSISERVKKTGASFLLHDVETIKGVSTEYGKYGYLLQRIAKILPDPESAFAQCHTVRVVYLTPEVTVNAKKDAFGNFAWFSFKDLPDNLGPEYAFNAEWQILRNQLLQLDNFSRSFRNAQAKSENTDVGPNYKEQIDFAAIKELCEREGNAVVVGYTGGAKALATATEDELRHRQYKWDLAEGGHGRKIARNWIHGSTFLDLVPD